MSHSLFNVTLGKGKSQVNLKSNARCYVYLMSLHESRTHSQFLTIQIRYLILIIDEQFLILFHSVDHERLALSFLAAPNQTIHR